MGMQEHTAESLPRELRAHLVVAVLVIAHDGKAAGGQVHTDLVGAPRAQLGVHQAVAAKPLLERDDRVRRLPVRVHLDAALAGLGSPLRQAQLDVLAVIDPIALDQRQVMLVALALAQHRMQREQRAALLGDHEQPGSFTVQPVHQLQELGLGPGGAQLLDHAERHAAAAMDRHAGGLVHHQHGVVLEHDREFRARHRPGLARVGQAQGRDADDVAFHDAVVDRDTSLVYPHLAATNGLVDMRFGDAFAQPHQVVIEALAGMVGIDLHHSDGGGGFRGGYGGGSFFAHCGKRHIIGTALRG
ncbi:hypothetical protein D3C86_847970 [compost metagenome]